MNPYFNINTYLSYEQRILTGQNYNEVDALVFAQLSYYPFELLIADYDKKQIMVTEFAKLILGQQNFHKQYSSDKQIFICKLAQSRRYSNCRIHHMRAVESKETQWAAFTVDVGYDGVAVVAMRGTDGTLTGWEENFQLAYHIMGTGAQLESFRYMKNAASKKIYMTGHSKGGSNICSAYVMSNPYIRDKILRMDNFDGPGVNPEFAGNYSDGYRELKDKLNNFYPADSIIGQLLEDNPGRSFYVKTKVRGDYAQTPLWGQHDPFAFLVERDSFVKAEQTDISKEINYVMDNLIKKLTNLQRYYFIRFIHRIGIPALISGENGRITELLHVICGLMSATSEEKKMLVEIFFIIIKSLFKQKKE